MTLHQTKTCKCECNKRVVTFLLKIFWCFLLRFVVYLDFLAFSNMYGCLYSSFVVFVVNIFRLMKSRITLLQPETTIPYLCIRWCSHMKFLFISTIHIYKRSNKNHNKRLDIQILYNSNIQCKKNIVNLAMYATK